jgi:hypothetical protein
MAKWMNSDGLQILQNIFFIRGHTHTNRQFPYEYLSMDSCVDPYRKTMEFHMKNLHECAHFPYLGVKKRGEKKSIKPSHPKGFSIWIPYGALYPLHLHPYGIFILIPV